MNLRWLGVAAFGCSSASSTPPTTVTNSRPVQPTHVDVVCPDSVLGEYWRNELFPGCPPDPFWRVGAACARDCPKPCSATMFDRARGHDIAMSFEYDAQGRWTGTKNGWEVGARTAGDFLSPVELPPGRTTYCTRDGAKHGHCGRRGEEMRAANERVDVQLTYDDEGNVITIREPDGDRATHFEYLPGHRIKVEREPRPGNSERRFDYSYDNRGWIERIASSGWGFSDVRVYTHDDAGQLATITTKYDTRMSVKRFEYDARGRLVQMIEDETEPTLPPRHEVSTYRYECAPPRPFEDAVIAFESLAKRACACTDAACKQTVRKDYDRFRFAVDGTSYADATTSDQYDRIDTQRASLDKCLQ